MATFEFRSYTLDLAIAGQQFQINCVPELVKTLTARQAELVKLAEQLSAGEKSNSDAIELCLEVLDDLLGPAASDSIFGGRAPTLTDCSDVLRFVIGEITEFVKKQEPPEV